MQDGHPVLIRCKSYPFSVGQRALLCFSGPNTENFFENNTLHVLNFFE